MSGVALEGAAGEGRIHRGLGAAMRRRPARVLAMLAVPAALGLTVTAALVPPSSAQAGPTFTVSPGSAEPGGSVDLSGTGCDPGGRAESTLRGAGGDPVGETRDYEPGQDGAWTGPYPVPEDAEPGTDLFFAAVCRDSTGEVVAEYPDHEFSVVGGPDPDPTPTPSPTVSATSTSTPEPTGSGTAPPTPGDGPTPTPTPTSDSGSLADDADRVVAALENGSLAFRPPRQMREGVSAEVVIQVQRPSVPGAPGSGLPGGGPPVVVPIEVSTAMTAELTGTAFTIEPSGPQRRTLTSARPAEWRWTVTPTSFGTKTLRLRLAVVLVEDPETPLIPQVTYDEAIEVRVHPLHTAARLMRTVQGALTGVGLSITIVVVAVWQWLKRRRRTTGSGSGPDQPPGPSVPGQRRRLVRRGGRRVAGPRG